MTAVEDQAGDTRTPFLVGARDDYNINLCDETYIPASRWTNRVVYTGNSFLRTGDDPTTFYLDEGLKRPNAAGMGYTGWQWRQNTSSPDEYAVVVKDAITGADVVKANVQAVYSKYWKEHGTAP